MTTNPIKAIKVYFIEFHLRSLPLDQVRDVANIEFLTYKDINYEESNTS